MADRFPALDDISGDPPAPNRNGTSSATIEDDNDFLARERAALGDDADQFVLPDDHVTAGEAGGDDLLGGDDEVLSGNDLTADTSGFESSFPVIDSHNENVAPGGTITGSSSFGAQYSTYKEPEEEPEPVRAWREKRDAELSRRSQVSEEKKAATVSKAQQDIDDYYESYNKRTDKARERTRKEAEEFLANREDTSAGGTSWERIAKLVDVSGKGVKGGASGSGKERFRGLLLELKKDEKAPGSTGI
ncbi:hypothetical protein FQN57_006017 [Myotisia sp. PD_48]|nr:hypothetical protein FQN57_006017 [Myotisia sp. PD_48]